MKQHIWLNTGIGKEIIFSNKGIPIGGYMANSWAEEFCLEIHSNFQQTPNWYGFLPSPPHTFASTSKESLNRRKEST
jgi:hypothetical protein